jgi:hypothetical protein
MVRSLEGRAALDLARLDSKFFGFYTLNRRTLFFSRKLKTDKSLVSLGLGG